MEQKKPSTIVKTLTIIHWALVGSPILLAAIVYGILTSNGTPAFIETENILTYFPIGLAITMIVMSTYMSELILKQNLKKDMTLVQKLNAFQSAHILRVALLEGASMFSMVVCLLSNTLVNYGTFFILLIFMYLATPTYEKIIAALGLSEIEALELKD